MTATRFFRAALIAWLLILFYNASQQAVREQNGETVAGTAWALGVLSVVFLIRALATEYGRGPEANLQKDILWGIGAGGLLAVLWNAQI